MSKYKFKSIVPKKLKLENRICEYYINGLISLGLSRFYILSSNYYYFGYKEITDQEEIKNRFNKIKEDYDKFIKKICNKYNCETIVLELGIIYTKLQKIHLSNNELLSLNILSMEKINDILYPSKMSDLMARNTKNLTEFILIKNNKKFDFGLSNADYKKLIMLLYYYSIYMFYSSKSYLSHDYENGVVEFYINPNALESICTIIPHQKNSSNINGTQFNYNFGIFAEDSDFNNSFSNEKGLTFVEYKCLINSLIKSLNNKKQIIGKIKKNKFDRILKENFPSANIEKIKKGCILTKNNFESNCDDLFKNNCKHRLDTTPIIDIGNNYYILNEGFLCNSINFWNNVYAIGLTPYISNEKDEILKSLNIIRKNISSAFENDIIKVLLKINKKMEIHHNKKSKNIFKNKNISNNEWDIIAIDHNIKQIYDIEAKFLSTSVTGSGLANDLKKLVGNGPDSYQNKFEKRIEIENHNMQDFLDFCNADINYKIIHLMVVSKVVDLNCESSERKFIIVHYEGLEKYILEKFYC